MKKPCREERQGLKTELNRLSFLFVSILISYELNAQVPINGFCKLNSYEVKSGYSSISAINYNNDSYTDLILFNKNYKNYSVITGSGNDEKIKENVFTSSTELSQLVSVYGNGNRLINYAYTSRKNRQAGFFNISNSGKLVFGQSFKFDSFPENISVADVNGTGSSELLISGNGFDGLSILHLEQGKLNEIKLEKRKVFSEAVFVDLSNDGHKDIAAFNLLNNSINFYYNYSSLRFSKVRSISTVSQVHNLKSTNMNLDLYEDLIYSQQNTIKIIYGDAISSYSSGVTVNTKYYPDKFITGDFNHDGRIDIAYINKDNSTMSLVYAKSEFEFYDEIVYLKRKGIEDIIPFYSKFINGLALISSSGEVVLVTNLTSISNFVNIIAGIEPSALNYFDKDNNGITDICYIDKFDNSLNLITRDNAGIPSNYYSIKLNNFHEEIKTVSINQNLKSFYCYSEGGRLIEIIHFDFKSSKFEKTSLYSPGSILDFKIKKEAAEEPWIYLSYKRLTQVETGYYQYKNFRYSFTNYPGSIGGVYNVSLALAGSPSLFYWQLLNDKIVLVEKDLAAASDNPKSLLQLPLKHRVLVTSITGDILNDEKDYYFSYLESGSSPYSVFSSGSDSYLKTEKELPSGMRIKEKKQLYFGELKFNGLKKISVYLPEEKAVKKIDFTKGGKSFISSKILDAENVDRFFIKNMNTKNYHLVYTNKNLGCITIKQLQ